MADSETSTSLSTVTRRMLLAGTTLMAAAWATNPLRRSPAANSGDPDVALQLWHEWNDAHLRTYEACCKQQKLETRLVETIGFPRAEVDLPDEGRSIFVHTRDQIEETFGDDPALAATWAIADVEFTAHQARWDAADGELGYSVAKEAEEAAAFREQQLVDALMSASATSLAGVAGKLDAILREGESSAECPEFPWPFLRSALVDLVRIARKAQPDRFVPGSDRIALLSRSSSKSGSGE